MILVERRSWSLPLSLSLLAVIASPVVVPSLARVLTAV
jgi:hypothetical protein